MNQAQKVLIICLPNKNLENNFGLLLFIYLFFEFSVSYMNIQLRNVFYYLEAEFLCDFKR